MTKTPLIEITTKNKKSERFLFKNIESPPEIKAFLEKKRLIPPKDDTENTSNKENEDDEVDLNENWISNENNIQLIYDLVGILIVFFLIFLFKRLKENLPKLSVNKHLDRFINYKRLISLLFLYKCTS